MVFNSAAVVAVAEVSTDTWQLIWRIPPSQRVATRELLEMAAWFPMNQLSRLVFCLWSFMCLPSSYEPSSPSSSSSDSADDEDRLAFHHNNLYYYGYYDDDDDDDDHRSSSSIDDYYSHSD